MVRYTYGKERGNEHGTNKNRFVRKSTRLYKAFT